MQASRTAARCDGHGAEAPLAHRAGSVRHAFRQWQALVPRLQRNPLLLFLDFDGTLASIVPHPDAARLPAGVRASLAALRRLPACRVTVVSGRALADIRPRIGLRRLTYAGNHGLEMAGPGVRFQHPELRRHRRPLAALLPALRRRLRGLPGVLVEDKGATLSVHYRRLAAAQLPAFRRAVDTVLRPQLDAGRVRLRHGKKVLELRPPVPWHKGAAVRWLLRNPFRGADGRGASIVYLGDDETDEDAFAALPPSALTIRVGRSRRSAAQYYLRDPAQVAEFLARLVRLRRAQARSA